MSVLASPPGRGLGGVWTNRIVSPWVPFVGVMSQKDAFKRAANNHHLMMKQDTYASYFIPHYGFEPGTLKDKLDAELFWVIGHPESNGSATKLSQAWDELLMVRYGTTMDSVLAESYQHWLDTAEGPVFVIGEDNELTPLSEQGWVTFS